MAKKKNKQVEPRRLNLLAVSDEKLNINPETIPTLVPAAALTEFMEGDKAPYHKIEAIDYPVKANGVNYQESFFVEFIEKMNDRPIPGSRDGHHIEWGKRPPTDLLVVGGKVESNGDGSGTAFLKNYIPPIGASGDNEVFLKEAKAGMIHFSLVSYTRDEYLEDEDGNTVVNVVGSIKGERNDAVEYDLGAMSQKVNNSADDDANPTPDDPAADEGDHMTPEEMLKKLSTLKANGDLDISVVAKTFNIEIVTDDHRAAVKTNAEIVKLVGDEPVEAIKVLQDKIKADETAVFNARMDKDFGLEKLEDGSDNLMRVQANSLVKNEGDVDAQIVSAKKNPILLKLAAEYADVSSDLNKIGLSDKKNNLADGPVKVEY